MPHIYVEVLSRDGSAIDPRGMRREELSPEIQESDETKRNPFDPREQVRYPLATKRSIEIFR